ncbi:hypothetical protein AE937_03945 [Bacteroides fragilis]|nr:hypothetical protein [Bacteroides fragilis]
MLFIFFFANIEYLQKKDHSSGHCSGFSPDSLLCIERNVSTASPKRGQRYTFISLYRNKLKNILIYRYIGEVKPFILGKADVFQSKGRGLLLICSRKKGFTLFLKQGKNSICVK